MSTEISLPQIKERWNDVLDALEKQDRIAWLAFFDARLARFESGTLYLDFSDSRKFGHAHEYSESRVRQRELLIAAIRDQLQVTVEIMELA